MNWNYWDHIERRERAILTNLSSVLKSVASTSSRTVTGIEEAHTKLQYMEEQIWYSNQASPAVQQQTSKIAANTSSMEDSLQAVVRNLDSVQGNTINAETAIAIKIDQYSEQMLSMMDRMHLSSLQGNAELEKLVRIGFWMDR